MVLRGVRYDSVEFRDVSIGLKMQSGLVPQATFVSYTYREAVVRENTLNVLVQCLLFFLMHREHVQGETNGVPRRLAYW